MGNESPKPGAGFGLGGPGSGVPGAALGEAQNRSGEDPGQGLGTAPEEIPARNCFC